MIHPDKNVQQAIVKLCDALCTCERNTGIRSFLILNEKTYHGDSFNLHVESGKPVPLQSMLSDLEFMRLSYPEL